MRDALPGNGHGVNGMLVSLFVKADLTAEVRGCASAAK